MSSIPSSVQPASTAKITAEAAQQQIATHVRQAAKFIRALDIMVLMSGWLVLILATWLAGSVIDHWLIALPIVVRWSIWLSVVALSTWFAVTRLTPLLVRRINPTYAAQRIEQIVPEFKNGLIAWFELQSMPDHGVPKGVMAALSYRAMRFIGGYDPSSTIDSGPLIKRAGMIVLLVIGLAVYGALSPKSILESGMRLAMPWLNTAAPTRVQILEVSPGSTELTYGVPLDVTADLRGLRKNEPVMVCYNTLDGQFSNIRAPLTASIEGFQFKGAVKTGANGVEHDMEYWIEAGDAVSRKYRVTLSPLPSLAVDRVRVEFPKYTRLQPREFSPTVDIEAVEGSKMDVWGSSNQKLSRARLVTNAQLNEAGQIYQAGEYLEMTVDGQTVQGSCWLFPSKQSFCLSGANVRGDSNIYPVSRPLKISVDSPPEIELVGPEDRVVKVAPTSRLTLEIRASDPDYGLTKVVLDLRQNQIPSTTRVLLEGADEGKDPTLARVFPVPLNLAALKASPGDRIEITATAYDNRHDPNSKTFSPNQTKSIPLILEVVAPAEAKVPPELQRKEPEKNQPNSKDPNKQSEQPQKDSTSSDKQDGSESGSSQGSDSKSGSESGNSESAANNNPNGSQDDKSSANDPSNSNGKESGSQDSTSSNSGNNEPGNDDSGKKESGGNESNSGESGKNSSGGNKSGNQASNKQESGKQESGTQNSGDQNGSSKESSSSPENSSKQGGKQGGQKSANQSGNSKSADSANGESSRNGSKKNSSNDKSNSQPANGDSSTSNSNDLSDPSQSNDPSEARQRESDKRAADRVKEFMEKQKSSDKGSQQGSKDGTPQGSKDGTNADNARNNDSPKGSDQKGDGQKGEQPKGAGQESSNNQPKGDSGNSGDSKQADANGSKPAGEESKGAKDPSKSGQPADSSKPENRSADGKQEGKPDGKSEGSQPKPDAGSGNKQGNDPNKGSQSKSGNSDNSQKGNDQSGKSDQSGSKSDQSESPGQSQSDSEKKDASKGQSGKDERIQRDGGEGDGGQGDGGQGDGGQGSKSGDKQNANSGSQGSDSKGSDSKGGDSKGSDSKGSDSKGSDSKGSDSKGSDSKGGDSKQGGDSKSGQSGESSKSQPQQGEGKQADNKPGDNKQADGKQGDGKQGDAKSGKSGESSKQDSKSGQQGAESKSSESKSSGELSSKSSGSEGAESGSEGSQGSEGSPSGGSKPSGQGSGKPSNGKEASQGGGGATSGGAGGDTGATEASNPNDAKKATDLVLDYLKRQRQQPDPELLKEMNWTEQDLRNFVDRYQRARDLTASAEALENSASELSRLRGDGKNASVGASGAADAYRNQIDAGGQQRPPENLRKRVEAFQEALKKSQK